MGSKLNSSNKRPRMTKIQYISLILLLIFVVSLVNLFYKPWLYDTLATLPFVGSFSSSIGTSTCPLYGLKCPTDDACDCEALCKNKSFVPFRVLANEHIYLMDRQLTPGTYCLPKGIETCNQNTSYQVFTSGGWKCIPRHQKDNIIPCHNDEAMDNSQNIVWDHLHNQQAQDITYETLGDGSLRYRCQCGSKDIRGNPMVASVPFVCSVDYCIKDFTNPLPNMGFTGTACECGIYKHQDPNDAKSPCVMERTYLQSDKLTGRVDCMSQLSWIRSSLFCPDGEEVLKFDTPVFRFGNFIDAVAAAIK